jgi:hypothetical protein
MMMKAHCAPRLLLTPGGNFARRIVAMMKVTILPRLPRMRGHLLPRISMSIMQQNCATRAMTLLIAWYLRVSLVEMPIFANI